MKAISKSKKKIHFWTNSDSIIAETTVLILNVVIQYYSQDKDSLKEFL